MEIGMKNQNVRIEYDSLGSVKVPKDALYGAQTVRALQNFQITGRRVNDMMYLALAQVKKACALANKSVGELDGPRCDAIVFACDEIISGKTKKPLLLMQSKVVQERL